MSTPCKPYPGVPKRINRKIGQAMHDYGMLQDGDRVLVAVSGGVDSAVLAWVLQMWLAKAPIQYTLQAVYIDNGFWTPDLGGEPPGRLITAMLEPFGIDVAVIKARPLREEDRTCYL
ncbi:MAG: tRNA 2-thiocytidine biosynthesis protein TtcA, partial [Desulfopila sp.]|nr:tRNA 2-thiocytidine biosynthesis protein TtcA [Desulfopila sp.]